MQGATYSENRNTQLPAIPKKGDKPYTILVQNSVQNDAVFGGILREFWYKIYSKNGHTLQVIWYNLYGEKGTNTLYILRNFPYNFACEVKR